MMKRRSAAFCLALIAMSALAASRASAAEASPANGRPAGTVVSESEISARPLDEWFRISPVPEKIFERMQGRSYRPGCPVPRSDLRLVSVLHYGADGRIRRGEIIVHRIAAEDVRGVLRELFDDAYPIERMQLVDHFDGDDERSMSANNSSGFNCRFVAGSKTLSKHAEGLAVDINPLYNPCVRSRGGRLQVEPEAGRPYADRSGIFPFKIDASDLVVQRFKARGWTWGGDWRSVKDYQHFEKPR